MNDSQPGNSFYSAAEGRVTQTKLIAHTLLNFYLPCAFGRTHRKGP